MGKQAKATELEVLFRILKVKQAVLEGAQRQDILQLCAKEWGLEVRQGDIYIAKAAKEIKLELEATGITNLQWHIAARLNLFNKAVKAKDFSNARQILDSLAKLQGLWVDKAELVGSDGVPLPAARVLVTFVDPGDQAKVVGAGQAISIDPDQLEGPRGDDIF